MDRGVIVDLDNEVEGFVPVAQLGNKDIVDPTTTFKEGEPIPLAVIEFDRNQHKIILSVNAYYKKREQSELDEFNAKHEAPAPSAMADAMPEELKQKAEETAPAEAAEEVTEVPKAEETTEETPEEGGEELSEGEDKEDDDKEVVKVKKEQLKMLEEEGICTCGDKCLIYPGAEDAKAEDLLKQGAKSGKECIILTDDNMSDLKSEGECKCGDVKIKCKKDKEEKNEGRVFSKKQLMESFLRNTTKKSLKRVLKERRELCEECGGRLTEGMCMECGPNEHHMGSKATHKKYPHYDKEAYIMDEEDIMNEKLVGKQHKLDRNKNGKIDAEDFKMLRKGRKDRRRNIDEEEMGVMDAIATGQGYLDATGDLDRDFDGIPNRLDMDNNDDGELDFSMNSDKGEDFIELDIDFLRNSEAPVKEPGIKEPTTKPGKGDKWRTIKRPKVDPRPKADRRMDRSEKPRPSYRRRGMFR